MKGIKRLMTLSILAISGCDSLGTSEPSPAANNRVAASEGIQLNQTINEYGAQCAALISQVPAFDCNDGIDVPITVSGVVPQYAEYSANMNCDRPALLPYGDNTFGQCTPFSKVLDLSQGSTQISAFCRREHLRPADSPFYDEVDVILHSTTSGDTCWFHAEDSTQTGQGFDASRVPPPDEVTPPPGHVAAVTFWWKPTDTVSKNCGSCHDADPFMYSPYIGQVWQHVPVDPFGPYNNAIGDFSQWPVSSSIEIEGNTCTTCHRIANLGSCKIYDSAKNLYLPGNVQMAAGMALPVKNGDNLTNEYPLSTWMPVNNFHSQAFWQQVYAPSVMALLSCCDNPQQQQCQFTRLQGN
ncbi:hypothetical protein [Shewanella donghaensis]|uniref:hypothetical protein n=1 Tax=Shewanella donghaensis TaxID=238836 RepID=UPI001181F762|nr:hypothetical protein [Shewanella donghaensis]